jgi:acyl transferase domain-containing protein
VTIPTKVREWKRGDGRRIAGLSSFGFSGTNAHVIVEEAPEREKAVLGEGEVERPLHVLTVSGKSESAVVGLAGRYEEQLSSRPELSLGDAAYTLNTGRARFGKRGAVVAGTVEEARSKLKLLSEGGTGPGVYRGEAPVSGRVKVAFLFTGQGSQYAGMGRGLYETQPVFRKAMERCEEILRPLLPRPLLEVLYPKSGEEGLIDETGYTQPGLFALEWSLSELWRSWGVEPGLVLGHSVGEYVASCVAGLFGLEDGLRLIAERGRLMQVAGVGRDVCGARGRRSGSGVFEGVRDRVSVAAVNGPDNVVLSGVEGPGKFWEHSRRRIKSKALTVSHAFHSPLMEPMLHEFEQVAR